MTLIDTGELVVLEDVNVHLQGIQSSVVGVLTAQIYGKEQFLIIFCDMMYSTLHVSKFVTCILAPTTVGHVVLQTGSIWCRNPVVLSEFRPPCPRAINDLTHASAG